MRYKYKTKICEECQEEFEPTGAKQKCCSDKCKQIHETEYNRKYAKKYRATENGKNKTREISKKYYLNNKEEILKKQKESYNQDKKKFTQKRKEYRDNNQEKVKNSKRISYQKNILKNNEKGKIYNQQPERKKKNSIRGLTRHYHNKEKNKCDLCDETENLEFHHPEPYNVNNFKILCKKHHIEEHNKLKMEDIFN